MCNNGLDFFGTFLVDTNGVDELDDAQITYVNSERYGLVPPDEWLTHTFHLTAGVDYDRAVIEGLAATGRLGVLLQMLVATPGAGLPGESTYARVSQLDVALSVPYLRGVQRNDGLGHSPPRGVQVSSSQRSLRGIGYR